jgi:hypothetical protein
MVATVAATATPRFVVNKRLILPTPFRSWPAFEQAMPSDFLGSVSPLTPRRPRRPDMALRIEVPQNSDPLAAAWHYVDGG